MSKASDYARRPSSPSARMRKVSKSGPSRHSIVFRIALMALGGLGMAFLIYLNYHVKVEHVLEAARDGPAAVHEGNGVLSHTRDTWSREWKVVADRFTAFGTLVGDGRDEGEELMRNGNKSEIELYMMHTHEHDLPALDREDEGQTEQVHGSLDSVYENRALTRALLSLSKHPIAIGKVDVSKSHLEDVLMQLYSQEGCANLPLFVSMANVGVPYTGK